MYGGEPRSASCSGALVHTGTYRTEFRVSVNKFEVAMYDDECTGHFWAGGSTVCAYLSSQLAELSRSS